MDENGRHTYILFPVPFCGARSARVFFVAKANEEIDASGGGDDSGGQNAGTDERIPHQVLIL